jgi:hypothetical protein
MGCGYTASPLVVTRGGAAVDFRGSECWYITVGTPRLDTIIVIQGQCTQLEGSSGFVPYPGPLAPLGQQQGQQPAGTSRRHTLIHDTASCLQGMLLLSTATAAAVLPSALPRAGQPYPNAYTHVYLNSSWTTSW